MVLKVVGLAIAKSLQSSCDCFLATTERFKYLFFQHSTQLISPQLGIPERLCFPLDLDCTLVERILGTQKQAQPFLLF
jgi:hypothetical protein